MFTNKICEKCDVCLDICWDCHILLCEKCDKIYYKVIDYGIDICYCKKCNPIEVIDLYKYMKDKYDETLTLKQIQNIINNY